MIIQSKRIWVLGQFIEAHAGAGGWKNQKCSGLWR